MSVLSIADIWTPKWDVKAESILKHTCACCGEHGHYQHHLEARIKANGFIGGVTLNDDGTVNDGHHRVVAARRLGIGQIPLESASAARARWRRDQDAIKTLVTYAPIPIEVWRWGAATTEAGYERTRIT